MTAPASTDVRKRYVRTAEGDVHIQEAGEDGPVVTFVTVTSFGGVLMPNMLPRMAAHGYRAIALDIMGYGRSDKRQGDWLMETFADNIEEAMAGLGVRPMAYVTGHYSGLIGMELAARKPAGLEALVLDGTPLLTPERRRAALDGTGPPPIPWTEDGAHAVDYWKSAYGMLKRLDPGITLPERPPELLRQAYLALLESLSFEHGPMYAFARFDADRRLGEIDVPTLCMCSDVDWNLPFHEPILKALAKGRELRWPEVHPLHQWSRPERAQEYVDAIHAFLVDATASAPKPAAEAATT